MNKLIKSSSSEDNIENINKNEIYATQSIKNLKMQNVIIKSKSAQSKKRKAIESEVVDLQNQNGTSTLKKSSLSLALPYEKVYDIAEAEVHTVKSPMNSTYNANYHIYLPRSANSV